MLGLLAASGLTIESLMAMGEAQQREALIVAVTIKHESRTWGQFDSQHVQALQAPAAAATAEPADPRKATMAMLAKRGNGG